LEVSGGHEFVEIFYSMANGGKEWQGDFSNLLLTEGPVIAIINGNSKWLMLLLQSQTHAKILIYSSLFL